MTDDLIERLRAHKLHNKILREAADVVERRETEIELLRAEIKRLHHEHHDRDEQMISDGRELERLRDEVERLRAVMLLSKK